MNLAQLSRQVIEVSKEAGEFIRNESSIFDTQKVEFKGTNDMVSYVDKTAEKIVVEKLSELLPEAGFITEEKTSSRIGARYTWIVDPLDGTTNFIHGIPTFSVSIALQDGEELVLGVIYEINRDECFSAWKGGGAFLNDKQISVSGAPALENSLVATGFPYYDFEHQEAYLNVMRQLMQKCHGLRRIGSAAVDLAYVACGRFDAYFEYNLNSYDIAAGIVLVREAGGEIFDFKGGSDPVQRREIIATNKLVSQEITTLIIDYFK